MKECSFRPNIHSYRKPSIRNKSSDLLSKFNIKRDSSKSASKIRSRELMPNSGNKFNDLHELSKHILNNKNDKPANEYEFEKSRDECTF